MGDDLKEALLFLKFAEKQNGDEKHLPNLRPYAGLYIQDCKNRNLSSSTVYKRAMVLGTLFHCHATDFGVTVPKRERQNIKRTRSVPASIVKRYTEGEKYKPIRDFITATGMRRSELFKFKFENSHEHEDGSLTITIRGKGGKVRETPVCPGREEIVGKRFLNHLVMEIRASMSSPKTGCLQKWLFINIERNMPKIFMVFINSNLLFVVL